MEIIIVSSTKRKTQSTTKTGTADWPTDRLELEGLAALQHSPFWLNSFIGNLLSDFAEGEVVTPQQVLIDLATCVDAIESLPENSEERKAMTVLKGTRGKQRLSRRQTDNLEGDIQMLRRRLRLASLCASFAETANNIEADTLRGVLERWNSTRVAHDRVGHALNEALKRSIWIERPAGQKI
jgi:hypothetical protein